MLVNPRASHDRAVGIPFLKNFPKILGAILIFIGVRESDIRTNTIYIPQDRIVKRTQRTTIGEAVSR